MSEGPGARGQATMAGAHGTRGGTLIVGLGNPILGDDGVGWRVAEEVRARLTDPDVTVTCLAFGGVSLMERLVGYRRVLVVDALATGGPVGRVYSIPLSALPEAAAHTASAHDTTLAAALAMGRALGADLPAEVWVVAVEAERLYEFSDTLSPAVAAAVPEAVRCVEAWVAG